MTTAMTVFTKPKDVQFEMLDKTISALGNKSGELSPDEKESARTAITSWEKLVIKQLDDKAHEMRIFLNAVESTMFPTQNLQRLDLIEKLREISRQLDMADEFEQLIEETTEYRNFAMYERPIQPEHSPAISQLEYRRLQNNYEKEKLIFDTNCNKRQRKINADWKNLRKVIRDNVAFREMLGAMESWLSRSGQFCDSAREKAELAKLNVSISSADVRDMLRELYNFKVEI